MWVSGPDKPMRKSEPAARIMRNKKSNVGDRVPASYIEIAAWLVFARRASSACEIFAFLRAKLIRLRENSSFGTFLSYRIRYKAFLIMTAMCAIFGPVDFMFCADCAGWRVV